MISRTRGINTFRTLIITVVVLILLVLAFYAVLWLMLLAAFAAPVLAVVWAVRKRRGAKASKRGTVTIVKPSKME